MSTVVITASVGLDVKDPADARVYRVDWDSDNLATGVTLASSSFTVTSLKGGGTLTKDNEGILAAAPYSSRYTQVRLLGGVLGDIYRIDNLIVTSESPAQTKNRSWRVQVGKR